MPRFILAETRALIIWALRCFTARQSWHNWPRRFLRKLGGRFQKINLNFVDSPAPLVSQEAPTLRRPLILYVTRIATSLSGKRNNSSGKKPKVGRKRRDRKISRQLTLGRVPIGTRNLITWQLEAQR